MISPVLDTYLEIRQLLINALSSDFENILSICDSLCLPQFQRLRF